MTVVLTVLAGTKVTFPQVVGVTTVAEAVAVAVAEAETVAVAVAEAAAEETMRAGQLRILAAVN